MTLTGSDYLLRLSALAVSFVGFSAVVVALRRALEAELLSAVHMHFVRFFIEGGLAVAAFGLLPGALSFTGLAGTTIWRLSSAAAAVMFSVYIIFSFRRMRRVITGPIDLHTRVIVAISIMATFALWVNTAGFGFRPNAAPYVLALTWFLVVGGWVFAWYLGLFFSETPSR